MLGLLHLCYIFSFQYMFVQCVIPSLNVRKIDNKIVARKRQDTLDMCRLFNEETAKIQHQNHDKSQRFKRSIDKTYVVDLPEENAQQRIKRSVKITNKVTPGVNDYQTRFTLPTPVAKDQSERADQIVEMLYANLDANGVTHNYKGVYRYYNTTGGTRKKGASSVSKKPSRRFPFAPSVLASATEDKPRSYIDVPYDDKGSTIRFKYGIIPYFIDPKTYDSHLSTLIISAFDYIEKATCIRLQRLRERPIDANSLRHVLWLYISNPLGLKQCVHSNDLAEMKGVQLIVFGYNCMSVGDIAHEIMHVLGFSHEHNRPDRDQFISILWDNIKPGYRKFFEISNRQLVEGLPYDYNSVLHYPSRAFSRNGKLTISTDRGVKIGQRDSLSEIDIEKVSLVYSKECVRRNRDYLTKTCPTAVKADMTPSNVTNDDVKDYFRDRLWPLGRVYYRFKDMMEFTLDERENIAAVISHIEKETCITFENLTPQKSNEENQSNDQDLHNLDIKDDSDINMNEISSEPGNVDKYEDDFKEVMSTNNPKYVQLTTGDESAKTSDDNENLGQAGDEVDNTTYSEKKEQLVGVNYLSKFPSDNESPEKLTGAAKDPKKLFEEKSENRNDGNDSGTLTQSGDDDTKNEAGIVRLIGTTRAGVNADDVKLNNGIDQKSYVENESPEGDKKTDFSYLRTGGKRKLRKGTVKGAARMRSTVSGRSGSRRHIGNVYVLVHSAEPGCKCPPPGKPKGNQVLTINTDCFNSVNDLLHLFGHVLGLDHQHNMYDRDSYLHINWENLTPDVNDDLNQKLPPAASVGFPYDYQSVMHFPWLQIKNGRTNIMYPIWNDGWAMGHWQGLSFTDVRKLDKLYSNECKDRKNEDSLNGPVTTKPTTSTTTARY